jgi:hypothetical protein
VLTYSCNTALGFLDQKDIELPSSAAVLTNTLPGVFNVNVVSVNGSADQNSFNNIYSSVFTPARILPKDFLVRMYTNNSTNPVTQFNETTWQLTDDQGTVWYAGTGLSNSTNYVDTIRDLAPGCYRFEVKDAGCNGLSWWANPNGGNGTLRIDSVKANGILYNFPTDIGCGIIVDFNIPAPPAPPIDETGLADLINEQILLKVYPVPASDELKLTFSRSASVPLEINIVDLTGRLVLTRRLTELKGGSETIDISRLSSGAYFLSVVSAGSASKRKLIVQK